MKSHRIAIQTLVFLAATAVLPAPALASSLLSGYGGPGQGNQAVLGSALLNGPKGRGGSGGSGGSGSAPSGTAQQAGGSGETSTSTPQGTTTTTERGSSVPAGKGAPGGEGGSTKSAKGNTGASGSSRPAAGHSSAVAHASFYPASERIAASAQGSTIPGSDIVYIILGAAILVSLGLLTRRAGDDSRRESANR
jgi:hypothetical protein